jgi:hypothetical protein
MNSSDSGDTVDSILSIMKPHGKCVPLTAWFTGYFVCMMELFNDVTLFKTVNAETMSANSCKLSAEFPR